MTASQPATTDTPTRVIYYHEDVKDKFERLLGLELALTELRTHYQQQRDEAAKHDAGDLNVAATLYRSQGALNALDLLEMRATELAAEAYGRPAPVPVAQTGTLGPRYVLYIEDEGRGTVHALYTPTGQPVELNRTYRDTTGDKFRITRRQDDKWAIAEDDDKPAVWVEWSGEGMSNGWFPAVSLGFVWSSSNS